MTMLPTTVDTQDGNPLTTRTTKSSVGEASTWYRNNAHRDGGWGRLFSWVELSTIKDGT
jgi:hypothetical protein